MANSAVKKQSKAGLIALAFIAFISLGLPDGLLGVAWPSIRANFSIPLDALGAMLFAGMAGYMTSSFFSGRIMARLGIGGLLAASCTLTGACLLGYTLAPAWWVMVATAIFAGFGAGAIDAGINTYIASEHSEDLMQWLHASFGVGITLGPIIMTAGLNAFDSWRPGYMIVGIAQISLGVTFAATASMWARPSLVDEPEDDRNILDFRTPLRTTLRQPRTWLSILLFFLYTGLELTLGHWVYTLLTESRGIAPQVAGVWTGSYWATFTIGRILAGLFTKKVGLHALLRSGLVLATIGAGLLWWNPSNAIGLAGIALVGFAIAPIFPGLVSGTRDRVGPHHAANTIGMQISAAGLGGSVIPTIAGVIARRTTLEAIPVYLTSLFVLLFVLYTVSLWKRPVEKIMDGSR